MERENKLTIDLFERNEERFFVPPKDTKKFLKELADLLKVKNFSKYNIVETIYFNNPYHEVPWGLSI